MEENRPDNPTDPSSTPDPGATDAVAPVTSAVEDVDEFDPTHWEVPVICKDCGQGFNPPYRHFRPGVVFHCPHCHGSFVPNIPMYRAVRDAFETFYGNRKRGLEEFARLGGDQPAFQRRRAGELKKFTRALDNLAHEMRPAGKLVKPKGLAAMFT
jgi:hypothetical protein